jgi:hypothetical protein
MQSAPTHTMYHLPALCVNVKTSNPLESIRTKLKQREWRQVGGVELTMDGQPGRREKSNTAGCEAHLRAAPLAPYPVPISPAVVFACVVKYLINYVLDLSVSFRLLLLLITCVPMLNCSWLELLYGPNNIATRSSCMR